MQRATPEARTDMPSIFAMLLCGVFLVAMAPRLPAQSTLAPELPPGVTLSKDVPGLLSLPPEVFVYSIEVDWTETELVAELEIHGGGGTGAGIWDDVAGGDPSVLKIQLAGFDASESRGTLELPVRAASRNVSSTKSSGLIVVEEPESGAPPMEGSDRTIVGGIAPWTYAGPSTATLPGWNAELSRDGASVGVNWLGTVQDWLDNPPRIQFDERAMLSTLNPVSGRSLFFIVVNRTGTPLELNRLTLWIEDALPRHHLLAVHSLGKDAYIGEGAWQLGMDDQGAVPRAAGAVLVLRRRNAQDARDFARLHDVQITASSYEFAFPPSQTASGRLWPVAQRPSMWMSRMSGRAGGEIPWLLLRLDRARYIETIRLIHAPAAGWSAQFMPGSLLVDVAREDEFADPMSIEFEPRSSVSTLRFGEPTAIQSIRIQFNQPAASGLPAAAKLMAVQILGHDEPPRD